MRFQYISDIHLEKTFSKFPINKPSKHLPLFLAGDIGHIKHSKYRTFLNMAANNWKHVFLISGNHEYNGCYNEYTFEEMDYYIQKTVDGIGNITYLNRKCVPYDDYLIVGATLWTYTPHETMPIKYKRRISIENERHKLDSEFIYKTVKNTTLKTIVMTHHLPSYKLLTSPFFNHPMLFRWFSHSDHLIRSPIQYWICGHSHMTLDTHINGVRFLINAASGSVKDNYKNDDNVK